MKTNTKIPVPLSTESSGFKCHGNLKVGDEVFHPNGGTTRVIQVHPKIVDTSYDITFSTGESIIAHPCHLWTVVENKSGKSLTLSTKELFDTHLDPTGRRQYYIPITDPIQGSGDLPIPPYLLGAWLGDGTSTTNQIGMLEEDFIDILPHLPTPISKRIDPGKKSKFLICRFKELAALWPLGLCKNKHIPPIYKRASYEDRLELLRGMLDTDGTVGKNGRISIGFSSRVLADDLIELVNSLGIKYSLHTKKTKCKDHYRGDLSSTVPMFKLKRKLSRQTIKSYTPIVKKRFINSVKVADKCEMNCISVEAKDGLYLVGSTFIATHNSFAMLADPVRYFSHPKFSGLLLRRTTEELRELIRESKGLYPKVFPKAKWSERDKTWTFPSGAQLWMSYLDREDDVLRYQGQAFSWIGFDELTQWPTPYAWDYMSSRLRTVANDLPLSQRGSTNPGGPGHWWVRKMFIDPSSPGKAFWATDLETGEPIVDPDPESPTYEQPLFKRRFIPASLKDNPYLTQDDNYRRQLLALPEHQRKQLLYGDWDVAEGAAFTEWDRSVHTCEPFDIPDNWVKFRACDYGYGSHSGVLWFAIEPKTECVYVYRELYVSKMLAVDLAKQVLLMERNDGGIRYGVLDSSLWHKRGDTGPSLAEQMIATGCRWRPSDRSKGSRVAGKNEIHRRLQVDEFTEKPRLIFFNTCTNIISQLPLLPIDKHNPEDIDTNYPHDHLYDALRYGLMSRPKSHIWDFDNFDSPESFRVSDSVFGY